MEKNKVWVLIHADLLVSEVLDLSADLAQVLEKNGLFCRECSGARSESLRDAAAAHGLDLYDLVSQLNERLIKVKE